MELRSAKKGPRAGNRFWGCTKFPDCRGTRDLDDTQAATYAPSLNPPETDYRHQEPKTQLAVSWSDRIARAGWFTEYTAIGSFPEFAVEALGRPNEPLSRLVSQSQLLTKKDRPRTSNANARFAAGLLLKILQRGHAPLPTLSIESAALDKNGLLDEVEELTGTELGFRLKSGGSLRIEQSGIVRSLAARDNFQFEAGLDREASSTVPLFDSDRERKFLKTLLPGIGGAAAGHWIWPQASLDTLMSAAGFQNSSERRVDFLFAHPVAGALAIELDGPEHAQDPEIDATRDEALKKLSVEVVRVPNQEIDQSKGGALQRVQEFISPLGQEDSDHQTSRSVGAIRDCTRASKFQFGVVKALQLGWLQPGADWKINCIGLNGMARPALIDLLEMLSSIDTLYGLSVSPSAVEISDGGKVIGFQKDNGGWASKIMRKTPSTDGFFAIAVDLDSGPYHALGEGQTEADIVIRGCFLPVPLALQSSFENVRRGISDGDTAGQFEALGTFLRHVFRKRAFRELQAEACLNSLRQEDSVVLLPTGAGKSLIYQLCGLLMPGITIVVDPIVALIEDQVEGLANYGIDRATGITSAFSSEEDRRRLLLGIERGEYFFVLHSPQRLQSPAFRTTLRSLAQTSLINLAVVDEAHCVSEWGHDFVPAYLNLARNIREFGKDTEGSPPPILALTGTASRAVLRDLLTDLNIDRSNSNALIRPPSFDRPELEFSVSRFDRGADIDGAIRGTLNKLPNIFQLPAQEFFKPTGRRTASGIVFVPFVNGKTHGVGHVSEVVRQATATTTSLYSGKAPRGIDGDWESLKREHATAFKQNEAPILVSTKAFGMGIDKPNIRYTVHVGMPGSLEAYYQEAGRAGRDRDRAHCAIIFNEFDEDRSNKLLDPDLDLSELKTVYNQLSNRNTDDDVTRALWFHLNTFAGQEDERNAIVELLEQLGDLTRADEIQISFARDRNGQERALHRLVRIGVVHDYEVDFGSSLFVVHLRGFSPERSRQSLLQYVRASQPGRVKQFEDRLAELSDDQAREFVVAIAELLIDFVYDVIERSRRRAIQEAVLLARNSSNDPEIRQRLLDYLQEGIGAEQLEDLVTAEEVKFDPWIELLESVQTPIEAGEIRGLAIRALESYPDHPGLLIMRAYSEMMCQDAEEAIAVQALETVFRQAQERYSVAEDEMRNVARRLGALAAQVPTLGFPIAVVFASARSRKWIDPTLLEDGITALRNFAPDAMAAASCSSMLPVQEATINRGSQALSEFEQDSLVKELLG